MQKVSVSPAVSAHYFFVCLVLLSHFLTLGDGGRAKILPHVRFETHWSIRNFIKLCHSVLLLPLAATSALRLLVHSLRPKKWGVSRSTSSRIRSCFFPSSDFHNKWSAPYICRSKWSAKSSSFPSLCFTAAERKLCFSPHGSHRLKLLYVHGDVETLKSP